MECDERTAAAFSFTVYVNFALQAAEMAVLIEQALYPTRGGVMCCLLVYQKGGYNN